ncbi:TPA: DegT/DnrJ/EryC1/StrS family aminotransferase [Candidatus Peribacteria bacterium]|jgi:dTDP-4-amino-4,6-dideoxygalactose transaminase|nr:DegT/DnrJ/EryC1/StrS family aminotransferase [Candidatus Peribacteria bacterium]|tara:strand:+ start:187 stop:1464 length:1278 start_codon:yes stop_codon:yes gene_type:complete
MNDQSAPIGTDTPVRTKPWKESNAIGEEERLAVERVMQSGNLSMFQGSFKPNPPLSFLGGPEVQTLEALAKDYIGSSHAISVNSATSGLYAAVGALGLGFGDEVIVSPYTMSACATAPLVYGAIPVFADVERETGCLDPESIRRNLTPRTKAILVVHQFGIPADMEAIMSIAHEHDLKVIEDCAQAWGASFKNKHVGTFGDIGIFSFNVHKTIQCGEGGLCVTNDPDIALRLQMIRNHGEAIVGDTQHHDLTNIIGFNYRMTEISAAIATEQLKKLDRLNAIRLELVKTVSEGITHHECLSVPSPEADRSATYYVYPLRYHAEKFNNMPRAEFVKKLKEQGIIFYEGYVKPIYMLPMFQSRTAYKNGYPWTAPENSESDPNYAKGACPVAEDLFENEFLMNLHLCPPQTKEDAMDVVKGIEVVCR